MSTATATRRAPAAPNADSGASERLFFSFSIASALVMVGVLGAWVFVKRAGGDDELSVGDGALDLLPTTVLERSRGGFTTLVDQADVAFAAGRIVEPRFDNALYFYRAALEQAPGDSGALAGVDRVVQWLVGQSELAVRAGDIQLAEAHAARIVELRPNDADASARFDRVSGIRELFAVAAGQRDRGDAAAAAISYRRLLALDADSSRARNGLRDTVAAIVDAGTTAASAGRLDEAKGLLEDARRADPSAPGVAALGARLEAVERASRTEARDVALAGVRAAIAAGELTGAEDRDAYALLASFEAAWPGDAALAPLVAEADRALLALGRTALSREDFARVERVLQRSRDRGLDVAATAELAGDLEHRRYVSDFARGAWTLQAISEFTVLEQVAPEFPDRATRIGSGWVDLEFTVDPSGSVRDVEVRESSARAFVSPSIEAIEGWRFAAPVVAGRPVPARGVVRFTFRSS
jgi:TonB family protein